MQDEQDRIDPKDMTPEQAYAEARRRIEAAVESGQGGLGGLRWLRFLGKSRGWRAN